ncbi:membrane protein [Paenibacillus baekrokdamisoli]|uniref:Membrane protein n=2 Tax=Paenibacillus baekrokdamisoli TaxID=1712516 RepID=A0A3G9IPD7_9BACL|nr:glycerol-3-phosphate acyltransferase [Paenibacillus baekrokdamisoli]MBB3072742.1 acyl-phosphate glycerol 3-phosphate acyltransferase [Paenibacillus baekrokdamisoli]BBH20132.1 membrane protein [Paenibacillus baekrokdamisoli]
MIILLIAGSFLSGSLMFSYWLGLVGNKNLKVVGDGNPGALNLWKASGYKFGIYGILLDFLKGYLPLIWVIGSDYDQGYLIVPLAIAPIAGHAFSPFLKGKGGKAIAVTFGVWSALTGFEVSLVYAVILALLAAVTRLIYKSRPKSTEADGLQVVSGMLLLSLYLYMRMFSSAILWVWFGNFVILVYTHRFEMAAWLKRMFNKGT